MSISMIGFMAEMAELQQESMITSLVQAKTNEVINRNNSFAQAANGVGRD